MRKKREKGVIKKWLWNGGMAAALLTSVAVFVVMLELEKRALTQYEKGGIYVAISEIPRGQRISQENYQEYLEKRMLDKNMIPLTAISDLSQIAELVAVTKIDKGVLLTTGMFETLEDITAKLEEPVIAGLKAEDLYQLAGGVLRAGDRVHIYSVSRECEVTASWKNVYVQEVFDSAGRIVPSEDRSTAVSRINVYLDSKDVEKFYAKLAEGTLRVVKVLD